MKLKDHNPLDNKQYRILDKDGKIVNKEELPSLKDEELKYLYKTMLYSRIIDKRALCLIKDKVEC